MRVQPIQNNFKYKTPAFRSISHTILVNPKIGEIDTNVLNRWNSSVFRGDLPIVPITEYIRKFLPFIDKINIYDYGCSNGSEPFSLVMKFFIEFGEMAKQKIFPIIAKDVHSDVIEMAKSGKLALDVDEVDAINDHTGGNAHLFFGNYLSSCDLENDYYEVKPILSDNVLFSQADIVEDYKNIKPENSIVFARNFWPYLSEEQRIKLAEGLYNQLDKNSRVIIGGFDSYAKDGKTETTAEKLLKKVGFKLTENKYIYSK